MSATEDIKWLWDGGTERNNDLTNEIRNVAWLVTSNSLQLLVYQAPLSMKFFRQEYWSGLPFPSPEDLPNPGIKNCLSYFHFKKRTKLNSGRRSQDGGGIGRGDHFLFYKFIERTTERWTKLTKQLLIVSGGHQAPRKAAHCLRREVGQKY